MIDKIIIVVSVLKICAGDGPLHSQPQSNQAISSQSFVRHDVPLSYKYSAVHIYSTPKPDQYRPKPVVAQHKLTKAQLPKEIQYAPIYNEQTDQITQHGNYPHRNGAEVIPENLSVISIAKTHLEPKPQEYPKAEHQQEHLNFVPGYNVELLQAVNRYPGHNAVYRSYPNMSPNDKINKVNFLNQYILYQKPEENYPTSHPTNNQFTSKQQEQTKPTLSPFVPKQHIPTGKKPKVYNAAHLATLKAIPSSQGLLNIQELIPHPKAHRMLLNIARTYNIAGNPQKAQHASLTMLKNVPSHTQAIIHIPSPVDIERNTRLLPIQSKQIHQLPHRLS